MMLRNVLCHMDGDSSFLAQFFDLWKEHFLLSVMVMGDPVNPVFDVQNTVGLVLWTLQLLRLQVNRV